MVSTNKENSSAVCGVVGGGSISCPPYTLVSVNVSGKSGDTVPVWATAFNGDDTATSRLEGVIGGPKQPPNVWASGGDGKLLVGWDASPSAVTGQINAYIVQLRSWNETGREWSEWSDDAEKTATDREHTFNGQAGGHYQVRLRARKDAGDTDDAAHTMPHIFWGPPQRCGPLPWRRPTSTRRARRPAPTSPRAAGSWW